MSPSISPGPDPLLKSTLGVLRLQGRQEALVARARWRCSRRRAAGLRAPACFGLGLGLSKELLSELVRITLHQCPLNLLLDGHGFAPALRIRLPHKVCGLEKGSAVLHCRSGFRIGATDQIAGPTLAELRFPLRTQPLNGLLDLIDPLRKPLLLICGLPLLIGCVLRFESSRKLTELRSVVLVLRFDQL